MCKTRYIVPYNGEDHSFESKDRAKRFVSRHRLPKIYIYTENVDSPLGNHETYGGLVGVIHRN